MESSTPHKSTMRNLRQAVSALEGGGALSSYMCRKHDGASGTCGAHRDIKGCSCWQHHLLAMAWNKQQTPHPHQLSHEKGHRALMCNVLSRVVRSSEALLHTVLQGV